MNPSKQFPCPEAHFTHHIPSHGHRPTAAAAAGASGCSGRGGAVSSVDRPKENPAAVDPELTDERRARRAGAH
ncbi:hypothetical protein AB0C40_29265 [Streptomyces brevispora]|uniref:hypothetical protein n=1 Tax=Streptomyces brevispora TaxID=887462 RepID=UPI0033E1BCFD